MSIISSHILSCLHLVTILMVFSVSFWKFVTLGIILIIAILIIFITQVTRLCDLSCETDSVTSVSWSERVSAVS